MNNPKVSVIITTCNRSNLLPRAIQSVINQTYRNFELHIVDDASQDGTSRVVQSFLKEYKNIFYWRHEKNKGLSAARNTGISKARGDYIAFLDDDDMWKPGRIEKQINLLKQLTPKQCHFLGVVYCGAKVYGPNGHLITFDNPKIMGSIREYILKHNLKTIPSTYLFPKQVLEKIGGFDENLSSSIDHDIWMKLAVHGYHAYFVDTPLVIVYQIRGLKRWVTNTAVRIKGVRQYVEKWIPTYQKWFGEKRGIRRGQRYFARVLSRLVAKKVKDGRLSEACCIAGEIYRFSKDILYNTVILFWECSRGLINQLRSLYSPLRRSSRSGG